MNPILAHLGFRPDDRVVIIHADDLGMCHATIPAVAELFDAGLVSWQQRWFPAPGFRQSPPMPALPQPPTSASILR